VNLLLAEQEDEILYHKARMIEAGKMRYFLQKKYAIKGGGIYNN